MTTEVSVMNKNAVAIAADSAATIGFWEGNYYSEANKIFSIDKNIPVGVMIYHKASILTVPCETIVKLFRKTFKDQELDNLEDYCEAFTNFLGENQGMFFPENTQLMAAERKIVKLFESFLYHSEAYFEYVFFENKEEIDEQDIINEINLLLDEALKDYEDKKSNIGRPEEYYNHLNLKLNDIINEAITLVFESLPIDDDFKEKLRKLALNSFVYEAKNSLDNDFTGVVFVGFGKNDIFPVTREIKIYGVLYGVVNFQKGVKKTINERRRSSIHPFAQGDIIKSFIMGIHPSLHQFNRFLFKWLIQSFPQELINSVTEKYPEIKKEELEEGIKEKVEQRIESIQKGYTRYIRTEHVDKITSVIEYLNKHELAEFAETLVHLTCIRKKYSKGDDSVAAPVDVAVISKGDGFIWIKRKNYFEKDINYKFFNKN